ncbi:MAG: hypothetical protein KC419_17110 [Anaerolineales bacterium]|nr:hypothetical protein [Anaerolineales bacterium]
MRTKFFTGEVSVDLNVHTMPGLAVAVELIVPPNGRRHVLGYRLDRVTPVPDNKLRK